VKKLISKNHKVIILSLSLFLFVPSLSGFSQTLPNEEYEVTPKPWTILLYDDADIVGIEIFDFKKQIRSF